MPTIQTAMLAKHTNQPFHESLPVIVGAQAVVPSRCVPVNEYWIVELGGVARLADVLACGRITVITR